MSVRSLFAINFPMSLISEGWHSLHHGELPPLSLSFKDLEYVVEEPDACTKKFSGKGF